MRSMNVNRIILKLTSRQRQSRMRTLNRIPYAATTATRRPFNVAWAHAEAFTVVIVVKCIIIESACVL